jgi:NSS family neurotransmitter:Na+ symporter
MLAMLGMAVGTGNIWRFPRVAASNGGGSFLVAWVVFLLLWSVPLILVEFAAGKETRRGPLGAFRQLAGPSHTWMGAWIAFVATAIMFYYSVVMGWTIRYLIGSVTASVPMTSVDAANAYWTGYIGSPWAIATHALAMVLGVGVVMRGVKGIENAARVLIPSLLLLVIVLAIRAVTLDGASRGLAFLFTPDWGDLLSARLWLEALTQNAWDTGAGWGLITAYAVYLRAREDTTLNAFLIWVPQLFGRMPGGSVFMVLFFLALVFAAWSSLIAMIELASRVLEDAGVTRRKAILTVGSLGFLLGLPSAIWIEVFRNQDWVWGVGLMVAGFFFAHMTYRYGVDRFRRTLVNSAGSDMRIGRWFNVAMRLVAIEAIVLTVWWLWQAIDLEDLRASFTLFSTFNVGTVLIQWAIALTAFLALNRWLSRRAASAVGEGEEPDRTVVL